MSIAIISVVVALTISAHAKNENLDGKWVAISSRAIGERLFATGLMDVFDVAKRKDKELARTILQAIGLDEASIRTIIHQEH